MNISTQLDEEHTLAVHQYSDDPFDRSPWTLGKIAIPHPDEMFISFQLLLLENK